MSVHHRLRKEVGDEVTQHAHQLLVALEIPKIASNPQLQGITYSCKKKGLKIALKVERNKNRKKERKKRQIERREAYQVVLAPASVFATPPQPRERCHSGVEWQV